jgi:nifR3 family TIM-barrel protein
MSAITAAAPTSSPAPASNRPGARLHLGGLEIDPPVMLAPMAGVTNAPFRTLCRRYGGGLYVSEMVGARGLIEGDATSLLKASFAPGEDPRSIQLYAVDPTEAAGATELLVGAEQVDHLDLNFGCPAPKVTRHGGGAALPWRTDLYAAIIREVVRHAGSVPVTVKLRLGIDHAHLTYLEAARVAQDLGVAAVTLHARTAEQRYGPPADWSTIARLVDTVDVPVLGNGDIWGAVDALRMVDETGCAGVVVGRGCLGRPWLFRDLQAAFAGEPIPEPPNLGQVTDLLIEHAELLVDEFGASIGIRELRKHAGWYLQGFPVGGALRRALNQVETLDQVRELLADLERDIPFDEAVRRQPRGHTTRPRRVVLPHGWLHTRVHGHDDALGVDAAAVISGG